MFSFFWTLQMHLQKETLNVLLLYAVVVQIL